MSRAVNIAPRCQIFFHDFRGRLDHKRAIQNRSTHNLWPRVDLMGSLV
jgi:hypothetical protein